jgi:predicted RNA binding protein YcfA (HicA-like mRNA interferase family)
LPKIPPLKPRKLIKILEKTGFKVARQKGSHIIMMNDRKTRIVIPVHPGKDIKPGLIRAIIREAGISREKFFKLLKEKRTKT